MFSIIKLFIFCFCISALTCKGQLIYQKSFYENESSHARGVIQTSDSCFLIYGMTKSLTTSDGKGLVMKVDASGNLLWAQKLGTNILFANSSTVRVIEKDGYVYALTQCSYNFKESVLLSKTKLHSEKLSGRGLNLSDYPSGIYMLQLTTGTSVQTIKLIKQ